MRVWDVSSRKCCMRLQDCHRDQELTALAVDTEGGRIITGSRHGDVKVEREDCSVRNIIVSSCIIS